MKDLKSSYKLMTFLFILSGFVAEHMDLRHFLTVGMISSGLLTIAFGMAYEWKIHQFAYFVTVQVSIHYYHNNFFITCMLCSAYSVIRRADEYLSSLNAKVQCTLINKNPSHP